MGVLFTGIVHFSGGRDSGKTTAIFECGASPEDICFIDGDIKGKNAVDSITSLGENLGMYINLVSETSGMKEIEYHNHVVDIMGRIEQHIQKKRAGKPFECIGFDNFATFENTFFPVVNKKPTDYRETFSAKGDIKGAQIWQASFDYESRILNDFLKMTRLLILTSHLKGENIGAIKTGRFIPDCKRPVLEKSVFRVFLYPSNKTAAPIGLVLKRPSIYKKMDGGSLQLINVLPRKMNPFTWNRVRYFFNNPVGDIAFLPDEMPDEFDQSLLTNQLTADQQQIFQAHIELAKHGVVPGEEGELDGDFVSDVKQMKQDGKTIPQISQETGRSISDVARALSE